MRIVSGRFKGKSFNPPKGINARPTTDFAKESLFNIVANHFDFAEVDVLDLFSGTGSISFEFASRGANRVDCVELNLMHIKFINRVIDELKLTTVKTIKANAFQFIKACSHQYHIIFADPPYTLDGVDLLPDLILDRNILVEKGWFILEHAKGHSFEKHKYFLQQRIYGSVNFSIFSRK